MISELVGLFTKHGYFLSQRPFLSGRLFSRLCQASWAHRKRRNPRRLRTASTIWLCFVSVRLLYNGSRNSRSHSDTGQSPFQPPSRPPTPGSCSGDSGRNAAGPQVGGQDRAPLQRPQPQITHARHGWPQCAGITAYCTSLRGTTRRAVRDKSAEYTAACLGLLPHFKLGKQKRGRKVQARITVLPRFSAYIHQTVTHYIVLVAPSA